MKPQTLKALRMLRSAGEEGVTTGQFTENRITRFSSRVLELRESGHHIVSKRLRSGQYRYTLRGTTPPEDGRSPYRPVPNDPPPGHPPLATPSRRGSFADRLYSHEPGFSWERLPSIVGRWQLVFDLRPGKRATYWERNQSAQGVLA